MGLIARVLEYLPGGSARTERDDGPWARVDPGGLPLHVEHLSAAGDDSPPLPDDLAGIVDALQTGGAFVAGYRPPAGEVVSLPGEVRRFGRDEDGKRVNSFRLRRDGSIELEALGGSITLKRGGATITINADGSIELEDSGGGEFLLRDGICTINGARITETGDVITALGTSVDTHGHIGSPTAPDGPVTPTGLPVAI